MLFCSCSKSLKTLWVQRGHWKEQDKSRGGRSLRLCRNTSRTLKKETVWPPVGWMGGGENSEVLGILEGWVLARRGEWPGGGWGEAVKSLCRGKRAGRCSS